MSSAAESAVAMQTSGAESPMAPPEVVEECRGVLEKHARSFSAAAVFLSKRRRDNAAIAYAFCRIVDDAVDEAETQADALVALENIEAMLEGERPRDPIVQAYVNLCTRTGVGLEPARDLILGVRSDLGEVRLASDQDLLVYCYRVAGTVGLMMCGVLGVSDKDARAHALDLGIAMQITNICRDVLEDADRGRIYLPEARLRAHGADPDELLRVGSGEEPSPALRSAVAGVVRELLEIADTYYASGRAGFGYIPARPRLAIVVARALYREIGVTLLDSGADPLFGRTRVGALRKVALTLTSAFRWVGGILGGRESATQDNNSPRLAGKLSEQGRLP